MKYFLDSAKLDEIKYAYENYSYEGYWSIALLLIGAVLAVFAARKPRS